MKEVLARAGVPDRAATRAFAADEERAALAFLDTLPGLYVVKTDGLAAGKGVVVTESLAEARDAVRAYLSGDAFGDAGRTCVIEEGLTGPELSLLVLCDGAPTPSRSRPRRTPSASATATPGRTPAAWARTRRCPIVAAPTSSTR